MRKIVMALLLPLVLIASLISFSVETSQDRQRATPNIQELATFEQLQPQAQTASLDRFAYGGTPRAVTLNVLVFGLQPNAGGLVYHQQRGTAYDLLL